MYFDEQRVLMWRFYLWLVVYLFFEYFDGYISQDVWYVVVMEY